MFRKDLINLLRDRPTSLIDIARELEMPISDVEDDLGHLAKSLKYSDHELVVTPARCHKCGFVFHRDKLHKPGKCPRCHQNWIRAPLVHITRRDHA